MRLSAVVLEDAVGDSIAPGKPDASAEGFPGMWERCSCARKPRFTSPADEKNRVWPATRGEWVLFVEGGRELPPLARFLAPIDADVVCPESPRSAVILRPPFAIRRTLLEALGGFQDLPCGLDDVDLGLRAQEAGASILRAKDWVGFASAVARPLDLEGVIALFTRHPFAWILEWGCERSEANPNPGEPMAQRFARIFGRPVPYQGQNSLKELADHFAERAEPPLLPSHEIARQLEHAEASGLYGTGPAGDRRFERSHAANWLVSNTIYFESIAERNLCLLFPPPRLRGGPEAEPLAIAIEGRYEVEVDSPSLVGLSSPSLSLPLPVEGPEQRGLALFAFEPSDFEAFIDETRATARLPLRPEAGRPVRIGYSFRCTVHEGTTRSAGPATPGRAPPLSPAYQSRLDAVFASIFGGGAPDANPRARARRIYRWILDHIPCRRSDRLGLFALDARAGNCAHRVRLFSLLCHRSGLEARERFGIPAGDLHSQGILDGRQWAVTVYRERIHPPIHVWAEVFLEDEGWMPVDFFGTDSGQRMMTPQNVRNPSTRARLRAWTARLDDYYFGNVDPYRVHFGQKPKSLGAIPSGVPDGNIETIWKVAWGTRHQIRTRLSGLPTGTPEVNL